MDTHWVEHAARELVARKIVLPDEADECAEVLAALENRRQEIASYLIQQEDLSAEDAAELLGISASSLPTVKPPSDAFQPTKQVQPTPPGDQRSRFMRYLQSLVSRVQTPAVDPHEAFPATLKPGDLSAIADSALRQKDAAPSTPRSIVVQNRYEVRSTLGRGGMGRVFLCYDRELRRNAAMKVMLANVRGEEGTIRLLKEAQAAAQLEHPAIMPIYDVGRLDTDIPGEGIGRGDPFFIMRLVAESMDLSEVVSCLRAMEKNPKLRELRTQTPATPPAGAQPANVRKDSDPGQTGTAPTLKPEEIVKELAAAGVSVPSEQGPKALEKIQRVTKEYGLFRLLELFERICRAMEYAHSKGIVHRDIKPANIILSGHDEVFVTDFGLVKAVHHVSVPGAGATSIGEMNAAAVERLRLIDGGQTLSGAIIGTPWYMPPEQAAGRLEEIDSRSDVYSLGAVLYEILTLMPPFQEENALAVLDAVQKGRLKKPSEARPGVDVELEAICLKAMARVKDERYASAGKLADDVRRYREGLPTKAYPLGAFGRFQKFVRRHKAVSAAVTVAFVVLAVVSAGFIWKVKGEARRAEDETTRAQRAESKANNEALRTQSALDEAKRTVSDALIYRAETALKESNILHAVAYLAQARQTAVTPRVEAGVVAIPRPMVTFNRSLYGCQERVRCTTFSPDGRMLASRCAKVAIIWNVSTGNEVCRMTEEREITSLAFSSDGLSLMTVCGDGTLKEWQLPVGKEIRRTKLVNRKDWVNFFFGLNGTLVAGGVTTVSGRPRTMVKVWSTSDGREVASIVLDQESSMQGSAFSPDGQMLAVADWLGVRLMDVAGGMKVADLAEGQGYRPTAFSPDGNALAVGCNDGTVKVFEVPSGKEILSLVGHQDSVNFVLFSPDGRTLSSGSGDGTVKFWNFPTGRLLETVGESKPAVSCLSFSADGMRLATGSWDGG